MDYIYIYIYNDVILLEYVVVLLVLLVVILANTSSSILRILYTLVICIHTYVLPLKYIVHFLGIQESNQLYLKSAGHNNSIMHIFGLVKQ